MLTPIEARASYAGPPPILIDIAKCESDQKQFNIDGSVVISKTNDVGLFQINKIHLKEAKAMGYDLYTSEGNTAFAIYLYNKEGTRPWNSSKKCWSKLGSEDS